MVCRSRSPFQEDSKVNVHRKQSYPNTVSVESRLLENYIWMGKIYLGTAHIHRDLSKFILNVACWWPEKTSLLARSRTGVRRPEKNLSFS